MRHIVFILIVVFLSLSTHVHGSDDQEKSGKQNIPKKSYLSRNISLAWENDLYYQHDCYFTNGFQIEFFHDRLLQSPFSAILIPQTKIKEGNAYTGLQLRQEIFTPKDLAADTISTGDHPYSASLTLAQVGVFYDPVRHIRIVTTFRLGILGPASLGFRTQELVHQVSNPSHPPQGWDHQLRNDLIINYSILAEKGILNGGSTLFGLRGMGRLGTLHTDLQSGLWFRLDARNSYFNRFGPSGDPGLNISFHLSANARYVFYDATLQGGMFNKTSPYVLATNEVIRWIGSLEAKLTLELRIHQMEIYTQLSTPRFNLAAPHGWMGIVYKLWF